MCSDGEQSRPFWQTVWPYISDKGETHHEIMLCKDDKIVSDPELMTTLLQSLME